MGGLDGHAAYDTIYHEHLRYYSLTGLSNLLARHGLEVSTRDRSRRTTARYGSTRRAVESARCSRVSRRSSTPDVKRSRQPGSIASGAASSRQKLKLYRLLDDVSGQGARIYGIGAPSRAATMVNYVGLDDGIVSSILEIKGSHKIGRYMPGTLIPVADEEQLLADQPDYALLFSWHIADELVPKLRDRGYRGRFIVPLPEPRLVE